MTLPRWLRWLVILAGLCASCATIRARLGSTDPHPGLTDAVSIVWAAYGRTDRPPSIRVVEGEGLTCMDPESNTPGFPVLLTTGWACKNGYTITPWVCSVSWSGWPWSQTALAHELFHAAQARHGIVDPQHKRPEWLDAVPAANDLLRARGL